MARRRKRKPLTMSEQKFAEQNHNIIYDYLHKKKMDIEEYYDIAAIGYVTAVMNYHRKRKLQKYAFTTIAWRTMGREILNYNRSLNQQKHPPLVFLEDIHTEDNEKEWQGVIGADDEAFNMRLYISDIEKCLEPQQHSLCKILLQGSTDKECRKAMKCNNSELKTHKNMLREFFTRYFDESCTGATLSGDGDWDKERAAPTKENGSIKQNH